MVEILNRYSLDGFYNLRDHIGEQKGEIIYFNDGKIIGNIEDKNENLNPTQKIFIGIRDRKKEINFLKIAPGSLLYPILWNLKPVNPDEIHEDNFTGNYQGLWSLLGEPLPGLLNMLVDERIMSNPESQKDVDVRDINNFFGNFLPLFNQYEEQLKSAGQTGSIFFNKL